MCIHTFYASISTREHALLSFLVLFFFFQTQYSYYGLQSKELMPGKKETLVLSYYFFFFVSSQAAIVSFSIMEQQSSRKKPTKCEEQRSKMLDDLQACSLSN